MLFLKQPLILSFICHKSATTRQNDSNKVSNLQLKSDLCNCVKTVTMKDTTPSQQPYKRSTAILGHPMVVNATVLLLYMLQLNSSLTL